MWVNEYEVIGDAYYALDQVADLAIEHKVEAVVLGGDLFHKNEIDGWSLEEAMIFCGRLREHGIAMYAIEGNHDRSPKVSFCHALGMIDLGRVESPVEISGITVMGLPPMSATKIQRAVAEVPPCQMLVLHSAFQHLLGFEGSYQLKSEDIPAHIKSVFVGDVHVHSHIVSPEGVHIWSSGSTYPQRLSELEQEHGVFVVSGPETALFVPLRSRLFSYVDWRAEEGAAALRERLEHVVKLGKDDKLTPVALVRSGNRVPLEASEGLRVITIQLLPQEVASEEEPLPEFGDDDATLLGCLPEVLNPEENPEEHSLAAALLASPATAAEQVQEFIKERMEDVESAKSTAA